MYVEVQEYNNEWPMLFQQIKGHLERMLHDVQYISIEHVGSTSVPGLCAKPVIDVDIIVAQENLQSAIAAIQKDGSYYFEGDRGIPDRYAIRPTDNNNVPARNVYICIDGSQALRNHLAIRDLCRQDTEARHQYAEKKRELSLREWKNVDEYATAKTEVLGWLLARAGFQKDELREIAVMNGVTQ